MQRFAKTANSRSSDGWVRLICDGGSTVSITHDKRLFVKLAKLQHPVKINMGKGFTLATHVGIFEWNIPRNAAKTEFWTIAEVGLYCPESTVTVASLPTWDAVDSY